eukprot:2606902-Amphidinium_carterae.1
MVENSGQTLHAARYQLCYSVLRHCPSYKNVFAQYRLIVIAIFSLGLLDVPLESIARVPQSEWVQPFWLQTSKLLGFWYESSALYRNRASSV